MKELDCEELETVTVIGRKWFTEKFVLVLVHVPQGGLRQLYRQRFIIMKIPGYQLSLILLM